MPLEEILFFIVIPYNCLFVHEVLKGYFPLISLKTFSFVFIYVFGISALLLSLFNLDNYYTLSRLNKKIAFYKNWPFLLPSILLVALFFICWDEWFTKMGIWGFNPKYIQGIYGGHLPLEEILFFIVIPYNCLFVHEVYYE